MSANPTKPVDLIETSSGRRPLEVRPDGSKVAQKARSTESFVPRTGNRIGSSLHLRIDLCTAKLPDPGRWRYGSGSKTQVAQVANRDRVGPSPAFLNKALEHRLVPRDVKGLLVTGFTGYPPFCIRVMASWIMCAGTNFESLAPEASFTTPIYIPTTDVLLDVSD